MPHCSSTKRNSYVDMQGKIDELQLKLDAFLEVFEDKVEWLATKTAIQMQMNSDDDALFRTLPR